MLKFNVVTLSEFALTELSKAIKVLSKLNTIDLSYNDIKDSLGYHVAKLI